jgi:hypothetical protein
MNTKQDYIFISKTLFFPKKGILVIGDLHLGYDSMLKNQGVNFPFDQLEETKKELELILKKIKAIYTLKKIIVLGDLKHHFNFQQNEIYDLRGFLRFLEKYLPKENIILIKGNHDTFTLKDYQLQNFYIEEELAFTHGDKNYPELFKNKKIKTIITGHLHPAVSIKDPQGIKHEKYKCFFIGEYKRKEFIVIPSFFSFTEGINFDNPMGRSGFDQIIPKNKLKSFETYVVGKNEVYNFGKYGKLNN